MPTVGNVHVPTFIGVILVVLVILAIYHFAHRH